MGNSTSYFLAFLLGAAIPTACVVVLLPSLCSRAGVGVIPAQQLACNTTQAADGGVNELGTLQPQPPATSPEDDDLPGLLRRAAMEEGNTVIMTFTNEAWTAPGSLLDLFLESFHVGHKTEPLLKHLIVVAVDTKAFELCQHVHAFCYSLDVGGGSMNLTTEQAFMSKDYLEMMWSRNKFQTRVLELGYGFIFTDVDILWFRNPLLRIPVGADIAISSDQFYGEDPYDMNKNANGGLVYARPIPRTIAFFKGWYEARTAYAGMNEQAVFDKVKYDLSLRHGVSVHFVDTAYFGGFCHPKKDFRQLCTFHGNCLPGLRIKLDRLRGVLDEWKQFKITGKEGDQNNSTRK